MLGLESLRNDWGDRVRPQLATFLYARMSRPFKHHSLPTRSQSITNPSTSTAAAPARSSQKPILPRIHGPAPSWSYGLIRDTGAILLDMIPDRRMANNLRQVIESDGDRLADFHLWCLGPGHLRAIISVVTAHARDAEFYRARLARFRSLPHVTVEVLHST